MLPVLVFLALAAFTGALLGSPHAGRTAYLHLILAAGAMPLIFGAMRHFIPVLTRTREAGARVGMLPLLALGGGAIAVSAFSFPGAAVAWPAGALLAMAAAVALLFWSRGRRTAMVGRPHPGLAWYEAALACLSLALLAILAAAVWPQHLMALRRFHLHLNTLGFIGMTAVGTLTVLMPTVIGRPDPEAGQRLQHDLPWAFAGTLLIAGGAAWLAPLAWVGSALWVRPLFGLASSWGRRYRPEIFSLHGAAPLLAAALTGFALSMLLGATASMVTTGKPHVLDPAALFVTGFLLPLVSGAASQLLPVWVRPGVQQPWHAGLRRRLGRYGGARAVLFLLGGLTAGLGYKWGMLLSVATLIWFQLQAAWALLQATVFQRGNTP
ncbi:MAG: hypothetical protein ACYCZA_06650 [Thiobacillus sp.]